MYPTPERTLTDADLEMIREITSQTVIAHRTCALNLQPEVAAALNRLTPEQIGIINRGLWLAGKASLVVGGVILTAIATSLIYIFTKGFWSSLAIGLAKRTGE